MNKDNPYWHCEVASNPKRSILSCHGNNIGEINTDRAEEIVAKLNTRAEPPADLVSANQKALDHANSAYKMLEKHFAKEGDKVFTQVEFYQLADALNFSRNALAALTRPVSGNDELVAKLRMAHADLENNGLEDSADAVLEVIASLTRLPVASGELIKQGVAFAKMFLMDCDISTFGNGEHLKEEAEQFIKDSLTALSKQGVVISRECAESALNDVKYNIIEYRERQEQEGDSFGEAAAKAMATYEKYESELEQALSRGVEK